MNRKEIEERFVCCINTHSFVVAGSYNPMSGELDIYVVKQHRTVIGNKLIYQVFGEGIESSIPYITLGQLSSIQDEVGFDDVVMAKIYLVADSLNWTC